jgi:polysaccharide biosynthesis protein PslG
MVLPYSAPSEGENLRKPGTFARSLLAGAALAGSILAAPTAVGANFGIADDAGKYAEGGTSYFRQLRALGMTENRISVHFQPDQPTTIVDKAFLDKALPAARAQGVKVVFHVFALDPAALTATATAAEEYTAFLALLARTYPQVREYVVGNEPNQPRFWQPQFLPTGRGAAAAAYGELLARSYDTLKGVDRRIRLIGVGLSGRGNDLPFARSNASTSPVRFLRDLGAAYRASGRKLPLMDELGVHPYPRSDRDSALAGDIWPRAGIVNVARIKQAVWDAFAGTGQPTVEQGLKLRIDEIGWQATVPAAARPAYFGRETASVTSERAQAANYVKAIELAACDRSISALYLLHLGDDPDLERFQSGLRRADGTARPALEAVRRAIARAGRGCARKATPWRHASGVVGANVSFSSKRLFPRHRRDWGFGVTAAEQATYTGAIFRLPAPLAAIRRLTASTAPTAVATSAGLIRAHWKPRLRFPARQLQPGRYVFAVRIRASMNPHRTTLRVSKPFVVD